MVYHKYESLEKVMQLINFHKCLTFQNLNGTDDR
jgi:hypothetical protein